MSAKRNEPRLYARPFDPTTMFNRQPEPPPRPPVRSYGQFVNAEGLNLPWPELRLADRGLSVADVRFAGLELRDLNATTGSEGAYLRDSKQPVSAVEFIGAQLVSVKAGAAWTPATASDFSTPIPVETGAASFQWLGEGQEPDTPTDNVFGVVTPSMRWGTCFVEFSRNLAVVSGGLADRLLARSHFRSVSRAIDAATFHGAGGAEPLGLENVPGVGSVAGATFSVAKAASMLKSVESGNANADSVSWAMSPDVAELLRQRPKVSGGERMLFEDGRMLDRPAFVSNSVNPGCLFVGDFPEVTVAIKDVELMLDLSTGSKYGTRTLLAFAFLDIICHRPASFCFATGVS